MCLYVRNVANSRVVGGPASPASNIALSFTEDAVAVGLTWFATQYPWLAAAIAVSLLVMVVVMVRFVVRAFRRMFAGQT